MIEIAGKEVKRADNVKFLGVLIDNRLSFKNHVSGLQKQVSMATGMKNLEMIAYLQINTLLNFV